MNSTKNEESTTSSLKSEQEIAANDTLVNTPSNSTTLLGNSTSQNDQLVNTSTQVSKTKFQFDVPTYGWKRNSIGLGQLVKKGTLHF